MTEAVTGGDEAVAAAESFNLATEAVTVNNVHVGKREGMMMISTYM